MQKRTDKNGREDFFLGRDICRHNATYVDIARRISPKYVNARGRSSNSHELSYNARKRSSDHVRASRHPTIPKIPKIQQILLQPTARRPPITDH